MAAGIEHEKGSNVPKTKVYLDKFAGYVVIVTEAAAGIGEATSPIFAQQRAQVILFEVDKPKLKDFKASIQQAGGKVDSRPCDISNDEDICQAVAGTTQTYKKIDALVNLAGIYPYHYLFDYPIDVYRRVISVNLDGAFFLTQAVIPHMPKAGYGRITHTSPFTYGEPEPGLVSYVASKAGIIGLVRATATEAGPGVTINAVMPSLIDTAHVRANDGSQNLFERVIPKQTVKRKGHPLDVAHTACFIASPEASFFSSQVFDCSGGETFH
ncbi:NAD(P)-binding protein [Zopfia rhizophila CBS 207.26]|uniref:NAD(P)-binding protein n=1 Tax=Zopfia rhizophila CBS 207.26 TaxID=1314779 RepID=A0A6A6DBX7_9PEZI|nr:NAD(P)-binding protein [Zopfia rhizophila CBS 207.26]